MREGHGWSGNERNCCFLNVGQQRLANVAAVTGLDLPDDGRALAVTDWDGDGKLDLWMSNRTSPRLRLLRNNLPDDSNYVTVKLRGVQCNRDAIGARVELFFGAEGGEKHIRTVRAGEGFLSQSSQWIHFGLGDETVIDRLRIRWPGGDHQTVTGLVPNRRYVIEQGGGAVASEPPAGRQVRLRPAPIAPAPVSQKARLVLAAPVPMPELEYVDRFGTKTKLPEKRGGFVLINVWASWCEPCIRELHEFHKHAAELGAAGLEVLPVSVDELQQTSGREPSGANAERIRQLFPSRHATATEEFVRTLDVLQRGLIDQQRPLALPTSFLVDAQNRLRAVYKGPVDTSQLVADLRQFESEDAESLRNAAVPFAGRWHNAPSGADPINIAMRMIEAGDSEQASRYLRKCRMLSGSETENRGESVSTQFFLARLLAERREFESAIAEFQEVLRLDPGHVAARVLLSHALLERGDVDKAVEHLTQALQLDAGHLEAVVYLGMARDRQGRRADAIRLYREALKARPGWTEVANNLAWILATDPDPRLRNADEALSLAQQACEATGYANATTLDTLAAAYAEAGRFSDAVAALQQAIQLETPAGKTEVVARLHARLDLYKSQQPFREEASP